MIYSLVDYLAFCFFAMLFIKAYYLIRFIKVRGKGKSLFFRWIFGALAVEIFFPLFSRTFTSEERRLKTTANIFTALAYLFFAATLIAVYFSPIN